MTPDEAAARIAALRAAGEPRVREFRAEVLGGRLLKPKTSAQLKAWMLKKASPKEGGLHNAKVLTYDRPLGTMSLSTPGTALWRLKEAVDLLTSRYAWREDAAVRFILMGEAPAPRRPAWTIEIHAFPRSSRVLLDCDSQMSHREVLDLFEAARRELPGSVRSARRVVGTRSCELAVFVTERNDGRRWEDARLEWTDAHPGDDRPRETFIRDARAAFKAVTGAKLEWKRRPGTRGDQPTQ